MSMEKGNKGRVSYDLIRRSKAYRTGLNLHKCRLHLTGWYVETYSRWAGGDVAYETDVPENELIDRVIHDVCAAWAYELLPEEAGNLDHKPVDTDFIENALAREDKDDFLQGLVMGLYIGIFHKDSS